MRLKARREKGRDQSCLSTRLDGKCQGKVGVGVGIGVGVGVGLGVLWVWGKQFFLHFSTFPNFGCVNWIDGGDFDSFSCMYGLSIFTFRAGNLVFWVDRGALF